MHFHIESPFHPRIVNLDKVRLIGGWENVFDRDNRVCLAVGEEKRFSFDISEAGPGIDINFIIIINFIFVCLLFQLKGRLSAKVIIPDSSGEYLPIEQTGPHKFKICFKGKCEGMCEFRNFYLIKENL